MATIILTDFSVGICSKISLSTTLSRLWHLSLEVFRG